MQYGPAALAAMVHLNQNHAVPLQRTAVLMKQLFGLPVSQAAVLKASLAAKDALQPTVQRIGQACVNAPVVNADETGLRVARGLHWLHALATDTLSWMGCHPKRGTQAFDELGLLQHYRGVLVHDGWLPYKALACQHALCNAHHLRELNLLARAAGPSVGRRHDRIADPRHSHRQHQLRARHTSTGGRHKRLPRPLVRGRWWRSLRSRG